MSDQNQSCVPVKANTGKPKSPAKLPEAADTQFALPKGSVADLKWSRKGQKLAEAMSEYVEARLLPKLQARTAGRLDCNCYDAVDVDFHDACIYLRAWLGYGELPGIAEFPFARLYRVRGGRYNVSIRRLIDWSRAEDQPLMTVFDGFWNQAPNAKFWTKIGTHQTFEECIDLLVKEPTF